MQKVQGKKWGQAYFEGHTAKPVVSKMSVRSNHFGIYIAVPPCKQGSSTSIRERLDNLEGLRADSLISESEYESHRQKILEETGGEKGSVMQSCNSRGEMRIAILHD